MIQLIFPGFEEFFGFQDQDKIIFNPEGAIDFYENQGYQFLSDWNSSKFLIGEPKNEPYIPDRIKLPSGRILDESELLDELKHTALGTKNRRELEGGFYFYNALTHEDMGTKRYDWSSSFIDKRDEKRTFRKYRQKPFYLEVA